MKKLVLTADELGLTEGVVEGIVHAHGVNGYRYVGWRREIGRCGRVAAGVAMKMLAVGGGVFRIRGRPMPRRVARNVELGVVPLVQPTVR